MQFPVSGVFLVILPLQTLKFHLSPFSLFLHNMGSSKSTFEKPSQQENSGFHIFELHLPTATYASFFIILLVALILLSLYLLFTKWPLFGKTRNSHQNPTTIQPSIHHKPHMVPFEMSIHGRHAPSGRVVVKPNGNGSYAFSPVPSFNPDRFLPAPPRVMEGDGTPIYSNPTPSKVTKQPLHSSIMSLLDTKDSTKSEEDPSHRG